MNTDESGTIKLPKDFEVIHTSGHDKWRSLEVYPEGMDSFKFLISDSGEIFIEFIALKSDMNSEVHETFHLPLSAVLELIEEAKQIATVTFD